MAEIFDFIVNDNRTITYKLTEPIMLEDNGVSDWRFHIPNTVNGLDATGWQWWLVYVNARNDKYTIPLTLEYDYDRPDAYSIATYTVDYGMSCKVGSIKFSIEAIDTNAGGTILHEWHTKTYSATVEDTLQGNQVEYAETESDIISALLIEVRNKVNQLVGGATPPTVNLKSLMTDPQKVYLYVGSEPNEHAGHWYYHNGTTFVSGGVYGAGVTDAVPTHGSTNAVSSGGVYDALGTLIGDIDDLKSGLTITQMQTAIYNAMNLVAFRPVKSTRYQGNVTNNGITYEWHDDNTCSVSGTASSLSFNNIYSDNTHFPSWLKKGETYVFKGGTNVSLIFYVYKNGTYYYGFSAKNTEREYTIPDDIDGLIMRLQVANGVTVNETIQPICRKKDMPSNGELYNLLYTPISIEDLEWTYGGLDSAGYGNNSDKRVRYKTKKGQGAFWVPQGTEISAASGYKFNVALYSEYQEEGNFTLIGYRGLRVGTYTVPKDCYIRVSVGNIANDILWTTTDGIKSFTDAGVAAQSALTITGLTPIPLNERVDKLEGQLSGGIITPWESAIELKDEIPLNALDFHALFDELVNNGKITRTLLANIGNDSRYPVYLYTLRNDMNHISTDYSRVIWDGSNELYHRPKIWLTGGIHGNERTMPFVIYSFIEKLTNNIYYLDMLNAFDWYFVPLVNPWGFSHSARDKTTGDWVGGGTYTAETKDNYDIYENTVEHHLGIRSVESGLDANRDFTTFATQEAQLIRDALTSLTADNRKFAFAIDAHLSTGGDPSAINALGAFMSPGGDASQSVKEFLFSKWMQAGAKSESIMADYCGVNNVQTVFAWDGTSDARIMRNYLQGYTDNAMCFEGGQTCVYYSGTTNWSNDVSRTFCNTQYQQFLKKLTEHWM